MPFRGLLIRIMLWSLGATAVAGATAALMGIGDNGWRIVATGLTTAVAAGLMLPFSILADKPTSRREGLLGMTLVILEFATALGLIWHVFETLGSWETQARVAFSMVFLGLTGLPAIVFLRFSTLKVPGIAGRAGAALCAMVFILLMIGVWAGHLWLDEDHWFDTAGAYSALGLLVVASLAGVGTAPRRLWRWIGVAASIVAAELATVAIWKNIHSGSALFTLITSVAAVVAYANLCLLVSLTGPQKWVRVVTILAAIATAGMVDLLALGDEFGFQFPMGGNFAAAGGIIASCGSLALLVLARINRNLDRVPVLSEINQMTVICPGCGKKQVLKVGESSCAACGLKFSIHLEEPRCPNCDYLLFMLQSDRCPECGTPVNRFD